MFQNIIDTIQAFGWLPLGLLVIVDIILWKIHPVLGVLGVLFTFALLLGFI